MKATSRGPWAPSSLLETCSTVRSFFGRNYHCSHHAAAFQIITGMPGTFEDQLQHYQGTDEIFLYQRPADLLSQFKTLSPANLSKTELENHRLFTEHATHVFDLALFECLSRILAEYLWQGTSPSLWHCEIQTIAAGAWMDIKNTAGRLIQNNFMQSFAIVQQNWPGVTGEEMAATDPWSLGAVTPMRIWYLQQLQKAVSGWLLHQGEYWWWCQSPFL